MRAPGRRDRLRALARRFRRLALLWQIFIPNALILIGAGTILLISPATVSQPVLAAELALLVLGLALMLAISLVMLRRVLDPLERLRMAMRQVDPMRPGERVAVPRSGPELTELVDAYNGMLGRLEDERRESGRRMLAAQEDERLHIARELHDQVGQSLTALILELGRLADQSPDAVLTERELEVVKLVAEGRSNKEIASELVISEKTVERHRENLLEELGMHDRVELTRYAIRQGLVEP